MATRSHVGPLGLFALLALLAAPLSLEAQEPALRQPHRRLEPEAGDNFGEPDKTPREWEEREDRWDRHHEEGENPHRVPPDVEAAVKRELGRIPEPRRSQLTALLEQEFATRLDNLRTMAAHEPEEALDRLRDTIHMGVELLEVREHDPQHFRRMLRWHKIEDKSIYLSQKLQDLDGEARDKARNELRAVLTEAFDLKQQHMHREITEMERDLERLRTLIEKREKHRNAVIEHRIQELTEEYDYLDW